MCDPRSSAIWPAARRRPSAAILLVLALLGALALLVLLRDPTPHFLARRSRLVSWSEGPAETVAGHLLQPVRLVAAGGLAVDLMVKRPATDAAGASALPSGGAAEVGAVGPTRTGTAGTARRPLIVLLGGQRTGREAARLVADTRGTVVAALSYPYRGDPRLRGPAVLLHA